MCNGAMSRVCVRGIVATAAAAPVGFAAAQATRLDGPAVLAGIVLDDVGSPVAGADVQMLDGGRTARLVRTDVDGTFRFAGLPTGPVDFAVRRIGYQLETFTLDLKAGEGASPLFVHLVPAATRLDSMIVVADRPNIGPLAEFRERRLSGIGTFFDSTDIARYQPTHLAQVVARAPGASIWPGPRGTNRVLVDAAGTWRAPVLYLDGVASHLALDDLARTEYVRGVEV
jgi:hypothetical protein